MKTQQLTQLRDFTCQHFGISVAEFCSNSRQSRAVPIVPARTFYHNAAREIIKGATLKEIGAASSKDHASVMHSIEKNKNYCKTIIGYEKEYRELLAQAKEVIIGKVPRLVNLDQAKREIEVFGENMKVLLPDMAAEIQSAIKAHSFNLEIIAK